MSYGRRRVSSDHNNPPFQHRLDMVNVHAKEAEADAGVGGKNDRSGQADSSQSDGSEQADVTSSEWKGIVATVDERIEWCQFQTLVTKNFSSWEDVPKALGPDPEVIVRLQLLARAPASSCTRCAPSAQPSRTQFVATNARASICGS